MNLFWSQLSKPLVNIFMHHVTEKSKSIFFSFVFLFACLFVFVVQLIGIKLVLFPISELSNALSFFFHFIYCRRVAVDMCRVMHFEKAFSARSVEGGGG